ncbi:MAG: Mrp/NBP35 family ATP-binding protein [Coriobacteriia bacterium]|nr:Mrp/NBP35 family ATP-binding protein [Coriobacteriia bacterium]
MSEETFNEDFEGNQIEGTTVGEEVADTEAAEAVDAEAADPAASCDSACSSCAESCSSRTAPMDFRAKTNEYSTIKHAIAVVSGKGGVGKSLITSSIASALRRQGLLVGILDADITGPSIPKAFGVDEKLRGSEQGILPSETAGGIRMVSTNLILPEDTTPVIWRGSIISGTVRQFYSEVVWGELDYLLIDMPPGTGDVPLTVYQSIPIDGVIIVTAPQDLVSMIVGKAINMAKTMEVPVLGIVENMAYYVCPDCGSKHEVFGASRIDEIAEEYGIDLVAQIPLSPGFTNLMDAGKVEEIAIPAIDIFVNSLVGS